MAMDMEHIVATLEAHRGKQTNEALVAYLEKNGFDGAAYLARIDASPAPFCWHLTWLMTHFIERNPAQNEDFVRTMWGLIKSNRHEGVQRDLWRSLTFMAIPEDIESEVFDEATAVLRSSMRPVATRVHAIQVAFNTCTLYPELAGELLMSIEPFVKDERLPADGHGAGLSSRAKKLAKRLGKLKR